MQLVDLLGDGSELSGGDSHSGFLLLGDRCRGRLTEGHRDPVLANTRLYEPVGRLDDNSSGPDFWRPLTPFVIRRPPGDVHQVMRPTTTLPRLLALLAAGSLLLAACGDDDTDAAAGDTTAEESSSEDTSGSASAAGELAITDFTYAPAELTAAPGAQIAISNGDSTAHTATAKDGAFDSGSIAAGESGSLTAPDEPGEYAYICSFHPFMKGTLTVE